LINPTIKQFSRDECLAQEGCLSIPGVYMDVKRPEVVEIAYKDEYGRPQTMKAKSYSPAAFSTKSII